MEDDLARNALLNEHHMMPILIGAKAAVLHPPRSLGQVQPGQHWWFVHGREVVSHLCTEVRVAFCLDTAPSYK